MDQSSSRLTPSPTLPPGRHRRNNTTTTTNNNNEDTNTFDDSSWAWRRGATTSARELPPTSGSTIMNQSYPVRLVDGSLRGDYRNPSRGVHFENQERDYYDYAGYGRHKHGQNEKDQQRPIRTTVTSMAPHSSGQLVPPRKVRRPGGVDDRGETAGGTEFGVARRPRLPMMRWREEGGGSRVSIAPAHQQATGGVPGDKGLNSSSPNAVGSRGRVEWDPYPDDDGDDDGDNTNDKSNWNLNNININNSRYFMGDEVGDLARHAGRASKASSRGVYKSAHRKRRTSK